MPGPAGTRMDDGFSTKISFSYDTTISLWEKEVTPPSAEGGDAIETTTMRNVALITRIGQALVDTGESTVTVAYDSNDLNRIRAMVNKNQQITFTYPNGQPETYWAMMRRFVPNPFTKGQQPTAVVTITPTNQNLSGVETAPVLGTTTTSTTTTTTTP